MPDLPSGTVTFLFTDIEGSTALWERDQVAMAAAVARHLTLLRAATEAHNGVLFKVVGDAVQAAFPTAPEAVAAALKASERCDGGRGQGHSDRCGSAWRSIPLPPPRRTGTTSLPGLNRLARLLAAGHGGQVLLSLATQDLARDALPAGASLRDLGEHPLRDLYRPGARLPAPPPRSALPTSPRSGRWPRAPTTCRCSRRPSLGGRSRWRGLLTLLTVTTSAC